MFLQESQRFESYEARPIKNVHAIRSESQQVPKALPRASQFLDLILYFSKYLIQVGFL